MIKELGWKGFPGAQKPRWSVSERLAQEARESIRATGG